MKLTKISLLKNKNHSNAHHSTIRINIKDEGNNLLIFNNMRKATIRQKLCFQKIKI